MKANQIHKSFHYDNYTRVIDDLIDRKINIDQAAIAMSNLAKSNHASTEILLYAIARKSYDAAFLLWQFGKAKVAGHISMTSVVDPKSFKIMDKKSCSNGLPLTALPAAIIAGIDASHPLIDFLLKRKFYSVNTLILAIEISSSNYDLEMVKKILPYYFDESADVSNLPTHGTVQLRSIPFKFTDNCPPQFFVFIQCVNSIILREANAHDLIFKLWVGDQMKLLALFEDFIKSAKNRIARAKFTGCNKNFSLASKTLADYEKFLAELTLTVHRKASCLFSTAASTSLIDAKHAPQQFFSQSSDAKGFNADAADTIDTNLSLLTVEYLIHKNRLKF